MISSAQAGAPASRERNRHFSVIFDSSVIRLLIKHEQYLETIRKMNPKGIILTGGPNSCYLEDSPTYSRELFELGIPVLGLCYGAQLMMHVLGGKVERADVREYGKTEVLVDKQDSRIFENVSPKTICWMSHFDYISRIAPGFEITAHTADCPVAFLNLHRGVVKELDWWHWVTITALEDISRTASMRSRHTSFSRSLRGSYSATSRSFMKGPNLAGISGKRLYMVSSFCAAVRGSTHGVRS